MTVMSVMSAMTMATTANGLVVRIVGRSRLAAAGGIATHRGGVSFGHVAATAAAATTVLERMKTVGVAEHGAETKEGNQELASHRSNPFNRARDDRESHGNRRFR
jgi:hypothetical protein